MSLTENSYQVFLPAVREHGSFFRPKKENVLFPVTLPTLIFWGLLKLFLKTFGILESIFRLFLRIFILFNTKIFIKKKVCLPTNPKNFGHVTGNKTYFSFGLIYNL